MTPPAWISIGLTVSALMNVGSGIGWHRALKDRDIWRTRAIFEDTEVVGATQAIAESTRLLQLCSDLYVNAQGDRR
jgi:hypothetical protein